MRQVAIAFLVTGLFGCSDDIALGPGADMAVEDMVPMLDLTGTADLSEPPDLMPSADLTPPDLSGIRCGTQTCASTEECCGVTGDGGITGSCVAPGTCLIGGGTVVLQCDGPEDCPGMMTTAGGCCATVSGAASMTGAGSGAAMCGATCPAAAKADQGSGQFSLKTKLCHAKADCKGYQGTVDYAGTTFPLPYDSCCGYMAQPDYRFCFNATVGAQVGADCSVP